MSEKEVFEKVKAILIDHTQYKEPDKLTMDSRLREDLNVDSLDSFEIIYDIENELKIQVSDEVATSFTTVGDIVKYITSQSK